MATAPVKSRAFGNKTAKRPHLVNRAGGMPGEIGDLRRDVEEAFVAVEAQIEDLRSDVGEAIAAVEAQIGESAGSTCSLAVDVFVPKRSAPTDDPLVPVIAFTDTEQTVAVELSTESACAQTIALHYTADVAPYVTVTVRGRRDGVAMEGTALLTKAGGVAECDVAFHEVTEIVVPAHGGAFTGDISVRWGNTVGLSEKILHVSGTFPAYLRAFYGIEGDVSEEVDDDGIAWITPTYSGPNGAFKLKKKDTYFNGEAPLVLLYVPDRLPTPVPVPE